MYTIKGISSKVSKRFIEVMSHFSVREDSKLINRVADQAHKEIATEPKGNPASHWKIKKVAKNVWQYDLPEGFRIEYTVDDELQIVFILFIGTHDDAATFLRGKK